MRNLHNPLFTLYFSLFSLLLFASCGSGYKIDGSSTVSSLDGKTLSLRTPVANGGWLTVDSAGVEHGSFHMRGTADSVIMVTLCLGDDAIMPLILEPGHLRVSISNADARVSGTPLNNALYQFIDRRNELETQLAELERRETQLIIEGDYTDDKRAELSAEAEAISTEASNHVKTFITNNYENVLGPSVFIMMYSSLPYPIITEQIEDIMRTAPMTFTQNIMVQDYMTKAKENMRLIEEHRKLEESSIAAANAAAK